MLNNRFEMIGQSKPFLTGAFVSLNFLLKLLNIAFTLSVRTELLPEGLIRFSNKTKLGINLQKYEKVLFSENETQIKSITFCSLKLDKQ